jgi:beta-N-acetylhexosaminidase
MVGVDVHAHAAISDQVVRDLHVGNVFLAGRTTAGVQRVKNLVELFTGLAGPATTHSTPMFIATDQEGGTVQVLRGAGFSDIPSALDQAELAPATLRDQAARWGAELTAAGVNLDLAPVTDLVPSAAAAATNPPVGALQRNYGFALDEVTSHANAFSAGMEQAGVNVALKHFPGLGSVTANTDTTAGVTDTTTSATGPQVAAFRSGIDAGAAFVMTSTAVYTQIDPSQPAAFSRTVVQRLLRDTLGFHGLVITDDLSAATQVTGWSPGDRAVKAIEAGNDIVLASRTPAVVPGMVAAVLQRARSDPAFAATVDVAAARVVAAKARLVR